MNYKNEKKLLRNRMKKLRSEISINMYRRQSQSIINKCLDLEEWQYASNVHIYISAINNEVETLGLIYMMFDCGKRVIVPKCNIELHKIISIQITSFEELSPSKYCLMEPDYNREKEIKPEELDIIMTPLLAFDRNGGRLGLGGGYYDDLLGKCTCPKVGLGYSFQEVDKVPVEPHDVNLDIIVTENEIIRVKHE